MIERKFDPDVIAGFIEEASGYLPEILQGIEAYLRNRSSVDPLETACRYTHTIKGAASMLGFDPLSSVAARLEEMIHDLGGQLTLSRDAAQHLRETAAQLSDCLDEVARSRSLTVASGPVPLSRIDLAPGQVMTEPESKGLPSEARPELPESQAPAAPAEQHDDILEVTAGPDWSQELADVFTLEAEDHLRRLNTALRELEAQPDEHQPLQVIRRSLHSLKGAAAMVGFREITGLAHRCEDLLDLLCDGRLELTPELRQLLSASTDVLEEMTLGRASEQKVQQLYADYAQALNAAAQASPVVTEPHTDALSAATNEPAVNSLAEAEPAQAAEPFGARSMPDQAQPVNDSLVESLPEATAKTPPDTAASQVTQFVRVPIARLNELGNLASELVIVRTAFEQRMADFARQLEDLRFGSERLRNISSTLETEYEAAMLSGNGSPRKPVNSTTHGFDELEFDQYTEFHLLSRELSEVTCDVQAMRQELTALASEFDSLLGRQRRLSSDLQDRLMRLRLVPLSTLATRLHRTVRSVAAQQGRQVELLFSGEDTQLDKTVIEELADPLQHILRNAVDHGIETPEQRVALSKPARGRIHIAAWSEGAEVMIQIRDDGSGLDAERLRAAAVRHGLTGSRDEAARMKDEELWPLIFHPGFSTCEQVSEISGRGVGLDIVQSTVRQLKGSITVETQPGLGTAFIIRLPITMAVMQALLVKSGGQTYAIPLGSVTQILRVEPEAIQCAEDSPALNLNGQRTGLLWLTTLLRSGAGCNRNFENQIALILRIGGQQVGLLVDQIIGGREIVVRSLGTHLRRMQGVAGATLMGDGSVVLILNVPELVPERLTRKPGDAFTAAPTTGPGAQAGEAEAFSSQPEPAEIGCCFANECGETAETDRPLTVMIVDDSPSTRRISASLLSRCGWTAIQSRDGIEALEALQHAAQLPDLILLDIEMPRMDGYQLLAAVREQPALCHLPVVMVTSRASARHRQKALDLGATDYLVKPWQDDVLISVVRRVTSGQQQLHTESSGA
ncbi:MAG: Hpt domain-containing protein [Blastocatellia bacterium]